LGSAEVIILDTHIWVWWVNDSPQLTKRLRELITIHRSSSLGVSIFSCWEVAKLVEKGRMELTGSVNEWLNIAISYPGVQLLNLTLPIAIQSTQLVGFHMLTVDTKIVNYPHVKILK
jgi:PIN domain nuclease of toxin-antitoxin system